MSCGHSYDPNVREVQLITSGDDNEVRDFLREEYEFNRLWRLDDPAAAKKLTWHLFGQFPICIHNRDSETICDICEERGMRLATEVVASFANQDYVDRGFDF